MKAIGNFIWFIFGGILMGLGWYLAGLLMVVTIIGIPWAKSAFVMGTFAFFPFGKEAISREELSQKGDVGTSGFGVIGNILWFLLAGWWLALGHFFSGVATFMTIIGIPFAIQHFKLAGISLAPIGKTIVAKELAASARKANAEERPAKIRC